MVHICLTSPIGNKSSPTTQNKFQQIIFHLKFNFKKGKKISSKYLNFFMWDAGKNGTKPTPKKLLPSKFSNTYFYSNCIKTESEKN